MTPPFRVSAEAETGRRDAVLQVRVKGNILKISVKDPFSPPPTT